jgi:hypothetical protein
VVSKAKETGCPALAAPSLVPWPWMEIEREGGRDSREWSLRPGQPEKTIRCVSHSEIRRASSDTTRPSIPSLHVLRFPPPRRRVGGNLRSRLHSLVSLFCHRSHGRGSRGNAAVSRITMDSAIAIRTRKSMHVIRGRCSLCRKGAGQPRHAYLEHPASQPSPNAKSRSGEPFQQVHYFRLRGAPAHGIVGTCGQLTPWLPSTRIRAVTCDHLRHLIDKRRPTQHPGPRSRSAEAPESSFIFCIL